MIQISDILFFICFTFYQMVQIVLDWFHILRSKKPLKVLWLLRLSNMVFHSGRTKYNSSPAFSSRITALDWYSKWLSELYGQVCTLYIMDFLLWKIYTRIPSSLWPHTVNLKKYTPFTGAVKKPVVGLYALPMLVNTLLNLRTVAVL